MNDGAFAVLPEARREIVRQALVAAFGKVPVDAITPLAGGATSAMPCRVDIGGRRYLLRVEGVPSPLRNPHQYEAMRIAAAVGIAPPIHYIDEASRVAVIDFVAPQPLAAFPGGPPALVQALAALLRRLQAAPAFPHFVDYPDIVARLFAHVRRTGLFAAGLLDPHVERLERLSEIYAAGATHLVSSHNDLIPSNILFDGERLWLIDWESACRNDPLVEVSTLRDTLANSAELQDALLQAWLGHKPGQAALDRLAVVRALTRLYYAGVFLSASAASNWTTGETDLSAPGLDEFQLSVRDGRFVRGAPQTKHVLGKMFLAAFYSGVPAPGFDAAV